MLACGNYIRRFVRKSVTPLYRLSTIPGQELPNTSPREQQPANDQSKKEVEDMYNEGIFKNRNKNISKNKDKDKDKDKDNNNREHDDDTNETQKRNDDFKKKL